MFRPVSRLSQRCVVKLLLLASDRPRTCFRHHRTSQLVYCPERPDSGPSTENMSSLVKLRLLVHTISSCQLVVLAC